MVVIACLGNPGTKYRKNRHNAGYLIGAHLSEAWNIPIAKTQFSSLCGTGTVDSMDLLLMLPRTFMNNSGISVKQALDYYRAEPRSLIVVHDEIELSFGVIRMKFGGGHKGHNGIRSITENLGTADFHRLRFGVGRPAEDVISVSDHVLSNFLDEELEQIKSSIGRIDETVRALILTL